MIQVPAYGLVEWSKNGIEALPAIPAGERIEIKRNGKTLEKTELKPFLPFLGAKIVNSSSQEIRIIVGDMSVSGFSIQGNRSSVFDLVPFSKMELENLGTEEIASGEIVVTFVNDLNNILKYAEAATRGLIPAFQWKA